MLYFFSELTKLNWMFQIAVLWLLKKEVHEFQPTTINFTIIFKKLHIINKKTKKWFEKNKKKTNSNKSQNGIFKKLNCFFSYVVMVHFFIVYLILFLQQQEKPLNFWILKEIFNQFIVFLLVFFENTSNCFFFKGIFFIQSSHFFLQQNETLWNTSMVFKTNHKILLGSIKKWNYYRNNKFPNRRSICGHW